MNPTKKLALATALTITGTIAIAGSAKNVSDDVVAAQRTALASSTDEPVQHSHARRRRAQRR